MDREQIAKASEAIGQRAYEDLALLVDVSTHTKDAVGAESVIQAITTCLLPPSAQWERLESSTEGCAPDLLIRLTGTGRGKLLLLGHLDTVVPQPEHQPLSVIDDTWHGSGTYDMKGGLVIACGVLRALAEESELYSEILLLVTCDEEQRGTPLIHREASFAQADCILCFEGGERHGKREAVVVRRKSSSSLFVTAHGQASHSGADIKSGRSALEALATLVKRVTVFAIDGDEEVSVTPTQLHVGEAINIIPASGWLHCDVRAFRAQTARNMLALVPEELHGVHLEARLVERFPPMDAQDAAQPLIAATEKLLGTFLLGVSRGGSSDANFFAERIPLAIDGLGPLGGADHSPQEYVYGSSFAPRSELALALAVCALGLAPKEPLDDFAWVRKD